jgi:hypothetical protein
MEKNFKARRCGIGSGADIIFATSNSYNATANLLL